MKIEPDFDAVYLGDGLEQEFLDKLYSEFADAEKPFVATAGGAPVFVVKLSMEQSRKIIKQHSSLRQHLCLLAGSEWLRHLGIDRCFDGWMHWIAKNPAIEQMELKQWLKTFPALPLENPVHPQNT